MKWKILFIVVAAPVLLTTVLAYQWISQTRNQQEAALIHQSRTVVFLAESAREETAAKIREGIIKPFDQIDASQLLKAVPIVSALKLAGEKAQALNYTFRVCKMNPRNSANMPDEQEKEVLMALKAGQFDEKIVQTDTEMRYFRPIRLTRDCLICHGLPKGEKDPLGGIKEGWHEGEIHGAFEIIRPLNDLNQSLKQAKMRILFWGILVLGGFCLISWLLIQFSLLKLWTRRVC